MSAMSYDIKAVEKIAKEVFALIDVIKTTVLKETGITLREEVEIWK